MCQINLLFNESKKLFFVYKFDHREYHEVTSNTLSIPK